MCAVPRMSGKLSGVRWAQCEVRALEMPRGVRGREWEVATCAQEWFLPLVLTRPTAQPSQGKNGQPREGRGFLRRNLELWVQSDDPV